MPASPSQRPLRAKVIIVLERISREQVDLSNPESYTAEDRRIPLSVAT